MQVRSEPDHTFHRTPVTDGGLERYAHAGASIEVRRVRVEAGVTIRTVNFTPALPKDGTPMVLVSGLSTVIESFRGVLVGLTETNPVVYVETREKPSSRVDDGTRFDLEGFAADVKAVVADQGFEADGYILIGFSLGAAAIMQAYGDMANKPRCLVLAEPVPQFRIPSWGFPLARVAVPIFPLVRSFVKWYLRTFRIDAKGDEEIVRIVGRALDSADPVKLRNTVLSIAGGETWDRLPGIDRPTLVAATSKDTLHVHDDITRMGRMLADCELVDMEDNTRTHSPEMAHVIRDYAKRMQTRATGDR